MIRVAIIQDSFEFVSPAQEALSVSNDFHITGIYYFPEDACTGLCKAPSDIVILDLHARQQEGIKWMKALKNKIPATKWLVYTMYDNEDTLFSALHAGVNGYILKEAKHEPLHRALHELKKGGAPFSPCILHKLLAYFHHQHPKANPSGMLSQREKQILHFTSRGLLYKEIAIHLGIQRETVKKHLSKIYGKLHVQNKMEAVNKFYGL